MIKEAIVKIVNKEDLTYDEAYSVIDEILSGKTTVAQNAAFLAALSTKGTKSETEAEIEGCAAAMRARAASFWGMRTATVSRPALTSRGTASAL